MLNQNLLLGDAGYNIQRSLRFRSSASANLTRTFSASGTTTTLSFWVKRGVLGTNQYIMGYSDSVSNSLNFDWAADNTLVIVYVTGGVQTGLQTTQVFTDPSSWYHIVSVVDTTQATASSRLRLYVNGVQVTSFSYSSYPAQNSSVIFGTSFPYAFGVRGGANDFPMDGYLTEINFIDGQALTPSSFGETDSITGVWKAKKYAGTYGTNGFYLNFSDNSSNTATTIGKDYSGNGNNWTPNNISVTAGTTYDSMTDVPTLTSATAANYAVGSPLFSNSSNITWSGGNLNLAIGLSGQWRTSVAMFEMPSSKWYWEATLTASVNTGDLMLGIINSDINLLGNAEAGSQAYGYIWYSGGLKINNGSNSSYGSTWATSGDVIGVAFDATTGELTFYLNGTSQGLAYTVSSAKKYIPVVSGTQSGGTTPALAFNFGQRPFAYTPPTGFVALNTFNLPEPSIKAGNKQMNVLTYSGDGTNGRNITGFGFSPEFLWIKKRSGAEDHKLNDIVRGVDKQLMSNRTEPEYNSTDQVRAFLSDGFTTDNSGSTNGSGHTYVAWAWKANGAGSSNTAGSITSQVSANPTAGFSVVTYTGNGTSGATIGHGLGVAPKMTIIKRRNATETWITWHTSFNSAQSNVRLESTGAVDTASPAMFNNTYPTSSLITLGNGGFVNTSGATYVCYAFAEVAGYSKFGSYTGNGSTDGTFVHLGFRPAFIMVKASSTTGGWAMRDYRRGSFNAQTGELVANLSDAEANPGQALDFLSNGFKMRNTDAWYNNSGTTYIYMAFAESPFRYSLGR